MSCHSCNSCNSQSSQSSSISDFFPSGYRFTSGYPKYPYYISVPVFVEEEEEEESCNCNHNCCCCVQTCCCPCQHCANRPCPLPASSSNCGCTGTSSSSGCGYNRIRCTTRFLQITAGKKPTAWKYCLSFVSGGVLTKLILTKKSSAVGRAFLNEWLFCLLERSNACFNAFYSFFNVGTRTSHISTDKTAAFWTKEGTAVKCKVAFLFEESGQFFVGHL